MKNSRATSLIQKQWFYELMGYLLDAQFFGYSLVGLGDFQDDDFPNLSLMKRENVVVDYATCNSKDPYFASIPYQSDGIHFTDPEARDENGIDFYGSSKHMRIVFFIFSIFSHTCKNP